jgi:hypothetical protein
LHWVFIPIAVFFACCVAQFWFAYRLRAALINRHPKEWLRMSKRFLFSPIPWGFVWSGRHSDLDDPILSRRVVEMRWLMVVAFTAWAAVAVGVSHPY